MPALPDGAVDNLFVITGGPGSGKTTLLRELEQLGFRCAPEVARQIIQEQVRESGTALPWADRALYTHRMLERSVQSYQQHAPACVPTFFDRGIPDTLGYARLTDRTKTTTSATPAASTVTRRPSSCPRMEGDLRNRHRAQAGLRRSRKNLCRRHANLSRLRLRGSGNPEMQPKQRADFIVKHVQEKNGLSSARRLRK